MINSNRFLVLWAVIVLLMSCSKLPKIERLVDPSIIQFSGEKALQSLTEFMTQFPNRDSGQSNNKNAAEWLDEEYGMLGTLRFMQTHPNIGNIIAGLSLDNVGKEFYNGLRMDPRGQFRGYGALRFRLFSQEAALSIDDDWVPIFNPVIIQILDQAVPISFMDEGPPGGRWDDR